MNTTTNLQTEIPVGDMQLFDNYISPGNFDAGNYKIVTTQVLNNTEDQSVINSEPIMTEQEFVVAAPQFSIDTTQIITKFPPEGSTGTFGEVLPHIVLKDPMLAWERSMSVPHTPWLALMVFQDTELITGGSGSTLSFSTTVSNFLKLPAPSLVPGITQEYDVPDDMPCQYIRIPVPLFQAIAPHLDELTYLSHVRKVNTGSKAILGINEYGLFSVTASNRFACAPNASSTNAQPIKNIVHLVSLEGMDKYLNANANFGTYTDVALISLASWTFFSLPDLNYNFKNLALKLISDETTGTTTDPTKLWLRLPSSLTSNDPATSEANHRLSNGYIPLAYHTRSGENTFAWYRGPFSPVLPKNLEKPIPFFTADSALIYDSTRGLFDTSLSVAWNAGRSAALADAYFGQKLLAFRKQAHQITDQLYLKLTSDHFQAQDITNLENTTTVQDSFMSLLTPQLIADIGAISPTATVNNLSKDSLPVNPVTDPIAEAKAFLTNPDVQNKLLEIIADDLAPVAEWLGNLLLLYPISFEHIIPTEAMLPTESLRFFYVDPNWLDAALDGALSLGLDSSRQTFFSQVTKGIVHRAAMQALAVKRAKLEGLTPINAMPPAMMSGFILRSKLVTGWPNMVIQAKDETDTSLKLLRLDLLSSEVLLCLFDGVPNTIEFSEPRESLGFGVNDDGCAVIRDIQTPGSIGAQIGSLPITYQSDQLPYYTRTKTSNVLNISPMDPAGLVQSLIKATNTTAADFGPAAFAIQLIKSPEAFVFSSLTT